MGGIRRSRLELEREQAEKLRLAREITALRQQLQGFRHAQAGALSTSTPGIRKTFATVVDAARHWDALASKIENGVTDSTALVVLKQIHGRLEPVVKEGERVISQLLLSFSKKGGSDGK